MSPFVLGCEHDEENNMHISSISTGIYAEHSHEQNDHALKFVGCLGNYRTEMPEFILRCFSTYPWMSLAIFGWDTER